MRVFIAIVTMFFFTCDNETDPLSPQTNLQKWQNVSTGNYDFKYRNDCFCHGTFIGPFHVFVRNGVVDSAYNLTIDSVVPENLYTVKKIKPIDQYFVWIDSILDTEHHKDTVRYNSTLGYPEFVFIDFIERMADDEFGFHIDSVVIQKRYPSTLFYKGIYDNQGEKRTHDSSKIQLYILSYSIQLQNWIC